MVHSTGANNPRLSRYVPGSGRLVITPGETTGICRHRGLRPRLHRQAGRRQRGGGADPALEPPGVHCGKGAKGSANDTHISFEICEDGLQDAGYFEAVYQAAVELTATCASSTALILRGTGGDLP